MEAESRILALSLFLAGLLIAHGPAVPAESNTVGAARNWSAHSGAADESGYSRLARMTDAQLRSLQMYIRQGAREALNQSASSPK
jgi:hypothetical protein